MDPSESLITAELDRTLESRTLARSARARDLLRYLIDSKRLGHAGRLKESTIALDVFSRDAATYDSATDGIVRVSVNRLRELLDRYYADEGRSSELRFEIQRGDYTPTIRQSTPAGPPDLPRITVLPLVNFTGDANREALHCIEDGRKVLGDSLLLQETLCSILEMSGDLKSASSASQKVLSQYPNSLSIIMHAAYSLTAHGALDEARALCARHPALPAAALASQHYARMYVESGGRTLMHFFCLRWQ